MIGDISRLMNTFLVYPKKCKGEPLKIEMYRFEFSKTEFVLYNELDQPTKEGFIAFDKVTAIVREDLTKWKDPREVPSHQARLFFEVYVKDREEPITISAEAVDFTDTTSLTFYVRDWHTNERIPLIGIYIARDDVIAVVPSDGLRSPSSRSVT